MSAHVFVNILRKYEKIIRKDSLLLSPTCCVILFRMRRGLFLLSLGQTSEEQYWPCLQTTIEQINFEYCFSKSKFSCFLAIDMTSFLWMLISPAYLLLRSERLENIKKQKNKEYVYIKGKSIFLKIWNVASILKSC